MLTKLLHLFFFHYTSVLGPLRKHLDSLKQRSYLRARARTLITIYNFVATDLTVI
jgi:hypothetical protein